MRIITAYPAWFIVFCLLAGLTIAGILYFREKRGPYPFWARWVMATARFLAVSILSFLLLSPMIRSVFRYTEKPIVVFALDNSASMIAGRDSNEVRSAFLEGWKDLIRDLSGNYEVRPVLFGDRLRDGTDADFGDKYSDFSRVFDEVDARYLNRNIGAVIVASDGILNRGYNPVFSGMSYPFPVYTIALGDTNVQKDAILVRAHFNRITYLNNRFPVEVILRATDCENETLRLTVSRDGQVMDSHTLKASSRDFSYAHTFIMEADRSGVMRLSLALQVLNNEVNAQNNTLDVFVEVLDARQKVLILAAAPHPDIGAIKQSLEDNENYEITLRMAGDPVASINEYNLVILHQLPSLKYPVKSVLTAAKEEKVPLLVFTGQQTDLRAFNEMNLGVRIIQAKKGINEAQPALSEAFALFTISSGMRESLRKFPPLVSPFAEYRITTSTDVLLFQKLGTVVSDYPLIAFNKDPERRSGIVCGEGIWKWRIQNYMDAGNHQAFDEWINKTVQFLSVREDRSRFRVIARYDYPENEEIVIEAELYNDAYELVNTPDAQIQIADEDGKRYPFQFSRRGNAYYLNAGSLAPGSYVYEANTSLGGSMYKKNGSFTISPVKAELTSSRADHAFLYALASGSGGEMLTLDRMDDIGKLIRTRDEVKPVEYAQKKFNDLVNLKWVFAIILLMLSLEWFMRKWFGGY